MPSTSGAIGSQRAPKQTPGLHVSPVSHAAPASPKPVHTSTWVAEVLACENVLLVVTGPAMQLPASHVPMEPSGVAQSTPSRSGSCATQEPEKHTPLRQGFECAHFNPSSLKPEHTWTADVVLVDVCVVGVESDAGSCVGPTVVAPVGTQTPPSHPPLPPPIVLQDVPLG